MENNKPSHAEGDNIPVEKLKAAVVGMLYEILKDVQKKRVTKPQPVARKNLNTIQKQMELLHGRLMGPQQFLEQNANYNRPLFPVTKVEQKK